MPQSPHEGLLTLRRDLATNAHHRGTEDTEARVPFSLLRALCVSVVKETLVGILSSLAFFLDKLLEYLGPEIGRGHSAEEVGQADDGVKLLPGGAGPAGGDRVEACGI